MDKKYNGINYKTFGENRGYVLVLLHGYLESSESWNGFAELFTDEYFVVCPDLPGHGKSEVEIENSGMETMAESVISLTDHLGIKSFHLAGHSMGGYVSLAILEKYPERLNSLVLLHSHCYSDPEEKKENRSREIELVRNGKKELIISTNIPRLYANDNLELFSEQIEVSREIALKTSEKGIITALNAMKNRPDCSRLLAETVIPVLLIGGRKDNLISFEIMEKMKAIGSGINLVCLEKSGHMGFIEERERTAKELMKFFDSNFECL